MPASRPSTWLICYDIADPRRLQRVHRTVSRHATPLQYSVFFTLATRKHIAYVLAEIAKHIHSREDDLRAYPLLTSVTSFAYGRSQLPPGIMLSEQLTMPKSDGQQNRGG